MSRFYRLAVISHAGQPLAVVEQEGRLVPVAALLSVDPGPLTDLSPLLADWPHWSTAIEAALPAADAFADAILATEAKFLPPVAVPGKLVCIGANYHDHINEMPIPMVPKYPFSFIKPHNNTLRGSGAPVKAPQGVAMMDYEAELGVVIGVECANVPAAEALSVVAGYLNFNDVSARDWIEKRPPIGVDWVMHKGFDGFAPVGPYLVPARFVPDPQDLPIRLSVNGRTRQDSSTAQMVFGVAQCIEHLSRIMTLYPGDIIGTGTPAGVAHGRKDKAYLAPGDIIRMEIGPLGELVTPVV